MKYNYKNKEYEVIKVGKQWRLYSTDPTMTKEEAMEVLKSIEDLEKKSMTDKQDYKRTTEITEKDINETMKEYGLTYEEAKMAAKMGW